MMSTLDGLYENKMQYIMPGKEVWGKALQKADSFVVLYFGKYKTRPVSKLSKRTKLIRSFVIANFLQNLMKKFAKHS